jgi:hypothetical protein
MKKHSNSKGAFPARRVKKAAKTKASKVSIDEVIHSLEAPHDAEPQGLIPPETKPKKSDKLLADQLDEENE